MKPTVQTQSKVRVFTLAASLSGQTEGGMADWPANIQDAIMAALERKSQEVQLPLAIIASWVDSDFHGRWYAYVEASEIIAAEDRVRDGTLM